MFRERIRENYDKLSKSQKRIADFLMTSQREAAFMTASRLATVLDVDVATITRFAQRLDYPGYPELLDEVRAVVQQEMSAGFQPVQGASDKGRVFVQTLALGRENVERTLANISIDAVEQAVEALATARHVYIVGQHSGIPLAEILALYLNVLKIDTTIIGGDSVKTALAVREIGAGDVALGFGFSGYAAEVASVLRLARERGARSIAISGSDVSAVSRVADVTLICAATSPIHLPSLVSAIAIIEALVSGLAVERMDVFNTSIKNMNEAYQLLEEYHAHPVGSIEESIMKLY